MVAWVSARGRASSCPSSHAPAFAESGPRSCRTTVPTSMFRRDLVFRAGSASGRQGRAPRRAVQSRNGTPGRRPAFPVAQGSSRNAHIVAVGPFRIDGGSGRAWGKSQPRGRALNGITVDPAGCSFNTGTASAGADLKNVSGRQARLSISEALKLRSARIWSLVLIPESTSNSTLRRNSLGCSCLRVPSSGSSFLQPRLDRLIQERLTFRSSKIPSSSLRFIMAAIDVFHRGFNVRKLFSVGAHSSRPKPVSGSRNADAKRWHCCSIKE